MKRSLPAWLLPAALALGGCVSVPQASPERDAAARQYERHPRAAVLYVFRNDFPGSDPATEDVALFVNGRLIGGTLPGTYFRVELRAGEHVLHGIGPDQGKFRLNTEAGGMYFVALNVVNGNSHYRQVNPEAAKREIARCCALLENWVPGQRPLLR